MHCNEGGGTCGVCGGGESLSFSNNNTNSKESTNWLPWLIAGGLGVLFLGNLNNNKKR
jgi:hypothetical protein